MTEQQLRAAELFFQNRLSNSQIAEDLGISLRSVSDLRKDPEVLASMDQLAAEVGEAIRKRFIGSKDRRLWNYDVILRRTRAAMKHRAAAMELDIRSECLTLRSQWRRLEREHPQPEEEIREMIALLKAHEASLHAAIPMVRTGMYRMELKSLHVGEKEYRVVREFHFDHQMEASMLQVMEQAAVEVGDWKTTVEHSGKGGGPIQSALQVTFVKAKPE